MKQNNPFASRTFKYGSIAVIFSAVFIAAIILINVVISAVNSKVGLYVDLTSEKIYGITDSTTKALSKIDTPVEIIFCQVADKLDDDLYLSKVKKLAETYVEKFPNVSIKYYDTIADPTLVYQYKTTSATSIPNTSVIVSCPSTKQYKVFARDAFFTKAESTNSVFGFNGEMRFTSAILQTARPDSPIALFTTGHGETVSAPLQDLLVNAGYVIETVDLKAGKLDSKAKLIVISSPQNDFTGLKAQSAGQVNEISELNDYLTNSYGNLMVFISPTTPALPELSEFLSTDWGVGYTSGQVIVESKDHSLSSDGYAVIGQYSTADDYAYNLHKQMSEKETAPKTISYYTTPLSILFTEKNYRSVSSALFSSANSETRIGEKVISNGASPMVVLSTYTKMVENVEKYARVLVFGSEYFTNDFFISGETSSSYGNSDMIYSALKLMGNENAPINIPFKPFNDTALTVDQTTSTNITAMLSLLVPALVLLIGTIVWFKRKRL